jgi:hypothetical protein
VLNAFYSKKTSARVVAADGENPVSQIIDNINKEYSVKEIFSAIKSSSKERKFPESLELIL